MRVTASHLLVFP